MKTRNDTNMQTVAFAAMLMLARVAAPSAATASEAEALKDASAIQTTESKETGRPAYSPGHGVNFKPSDHVFVKSALAVDFTYRTASVTLPLFRGLSPQGKDVFYIITEASDFEVARRMGINYAPKLAEAIGSPGVQNVTLQDGIIKFAGNVDFSPTYKVVAGDPPGYFPPKVANPGSVADDQWSSIVALPSGSRAQCADRAKRLRQAQSRQSRRHRGPHGDAVDPGRGTGW